jgi:hypothetical protein
MVVRPPPKNNEKINEFYLHAPNNWFNVSQTIIFQSFSDIADARTDIAVTPILLSQNNSGALSVALRGAFAARRANYRLFVFMTSRLLEKAGKALGNIPSYIVTPTDIFEIYQNAVALSKAENLSQVFVGFPDNLQLEWALINRMAASVGRLWWDNDSVMNLSKLVIQKADVYLREQLRVHDQQVRNSYLYSTVPTIVVLSVFLIAIVLDFRTPVLRRLANWLAVIRRSENRNVELRPRDHTILMAPGIALILALASVPAQISLQCSHV